MKKVVLITFIILFVGILSTFIFLEFKNTKLKEENKNLSKEIITLTDKNNAIKEENKTKEEEISTLEEKNKDALEEQEIWKETKEKLQKALS